MKLVKLLAWIFGIAIAAVIALAVVVPLVFDPNDYKDDIAALVKKETGRDLSIQGDIGLTVFPWLAMELGPTTLGNAKGFGDKAFAEIKGADIRVRLMPLLRQEIEIGVISLDGLRLVLMKDKNGRTNWADLAAADKKTPEPTTDAGQVDLPAQWSLGGVQVRNAELLWDDLQSGSRHQLTDLGLKTGAMDGESPFDIELTFHVASGDVSADVGLQSTINLSADFQRMQAKDLDFSFKASGKTLPVETLDGRMTGNVALDLEKETLAIDDLRLLVADLKADGAVQGQKILGDNAKFSGKFKLNEFNPRAVMKSMGTAVPVTADTTVLSKAEAAFDYTFANDRISLDGLTLRLDDTSIAGTLAVANFAKPAIGFDLKLDDMDLDRYLPPVTETDKEVSRPASSKTPTPEPDLPVDSLRALNLDGKIIIKTLKAYQLRTRDVTVHIKARNGKVDIHPAKAALYGGSYQGHVQLDVSGGQPVIRMDERVNGVQAGPLLKDLTGSDRLLGTANVHVALDARGKNIQAMRRALNGQTKFSFTDGAVKGVNIARVIREAQAKLKGQSLSGDAGENQTDFSELSASAVITNGVVRNKDLMAKSPYLRVNGEGSVDLTKETIDYTLTTTLVKTDKGQGGEVLTDLKGIAIPVNIGGTFAKPTYRPDLVAAIKETKKAEVKEKVEEKKEELKDKLNKKLGDKFKGLLQ